jgi:hypothetical protein
MSTSSLLKANNIVWELVKKPFSAQQNFIVYKQRPMPDLSTCLIGKGFQMLWYSKKEWLRLNKLLVFSYCYFVLNI